MKQSFQDQMTAADELVDRAAEQIQQSEPEEELVKQAADRVWEQLAGKHNARRGMQIVRDDVPPLHLQDLEDEPPKAANDQGVRWGFWALAAALVLGIAVAQLLVREMWPSGPSATVQTVDGQLFRIDATTHVPLSEGSEIMEGDVVRTSRQGGAVLRLSDGSLVELAPRSEASIDDSRRGTTIDLGRGNVIVEAAKQRDRHLYVSTDDCLVSVTGTIFSVNHGTKGSRVSVIEGEVRVDHSGREDVLNPGDQITTHRLLAPLSVADEIAWSRDVDNYLEILREYTQLRQEIDRRVEFPDLRYSSRLLDLMPEGTVMYAAAPNLGVAVTETHQVFEERLADSPALRDWLEGHAHGFQEHLDQVVEVFGQFGSFLGEELAVGGEVSNDDGQVVVLAEVEDADGLRVYIADLYAEHGGEIEHPGGLDAVFIDSPDAAVGEGFWVIFHNGLAIGSNDADTLRGVMAIADGAGNAFVGSPFHQSLSELYVDGAEFVVGADIHELVMASLEEGETDEQRDQMFAALGIDNARHLIFEQKKVGDKTHHGLAFTFDEARRGMASWLAEPAPMGALDFVSPTATVAFAAVFKNPAQLLDELLALSGDVPSGLSEFEQRYGLSLRDDVAASIGGEMVIAIDGPLLPKPAWKVAVEVYDPARLQWALEQAVLEANRQLMSDGKESIEILETQANGRTYYTLPAEIVDIHYTYVEGYMLLAGNRALLDQAIRYRTSSYSLTSSPKFHALLPTDGSNNFSAIVYQDMTGIAATVAETLGGGQLTPEQAQTLEAMSLDGPMLAYAYGEPQKITLAASSESSFLESIMLRAMGIKNPASLETLFEGIDG